MQSLLLVCNFMECNSSLCSYVQAVGSGAKMSIEECQHQFHMSRWNCTTFGNTSSVFGQVISISEYHTQGGFSYQTLTDILYQLQDLIVCSPAIFLRAVCEMDGEILDGKFIHHVSLLENGHEYNYIIFLLRYLLSKCLLIVCCLNNVKYLFFYFYKDKKFKFKI